MGEYDKKHNKEQIHPDLKKNHFVVISWHKEESVVSE
jgi:hypothetical protein